MKMICQTVELRNAIAKVQRAVAVRSTMPILDGILLEAGEDLVLTGYDMEMGITCRIPAEVVQPGKIVITSKMLSDIARKLPDETVSFDVNAEQTVHIESGKSVFNIKGRAADAYPVMPEVAKENELTISQVVLKNMIRSTLFAISNDEQRRNLNGSLLKCSGNTIEMVSIDGFRLAMAKEVSPVELPTLQFTIHGKSLRELMSILSDEESAITLYTTQNHIKFNFGNVTMISRLIQGEFMSYERLMPDNAQTVVKIKTKDLQRAVERAMLLIENDNLRYPVNFKTETPTLFSVLENTNVGDLHEDIEVELSGDLIDIDFNPIYYNDALKVIEDEWISIQFNGKVGPSLIRPVEGEHFVYLIMPLRR